MGFIHGENPGQHVLFPGSLDEYVTAENPVRFLAAFVDSLDLDALGFKRARPAATGRPPYAPRDLLCLYVYGYLYKIRSSRNLERETHRNVELMWLLRKLRPDFKTIADFRRDNGGAIRKACREFTIVCKKLDLFGQELIAVDGSKFLASNNHRKSFTQDRLRETIAKIDERIANYLRALDTTDRSETNITSGETALTEKIAHLKDKVEEARVLLGYMEEKRMSEVSLTDPDARRMICGPVTEVCYNAQIAVDAKSHLIAAEEVTNQPTDREWLSRMAIAANEVIAGENLEVVADKGYSSVAEVKKCLEANIVPYVARPSTSANRKLGLYTKEDFRYQAEEDVYLCPAGERLTYRHTSEEEGRRIKYYATPACRGCPVRDKCTRTKRNGRRITRHVDEALLEEMEQRLRTRPDMSLRRKSTVEHVFGTLKRWRDERHFLMRGLENVRTEFSLSTLAYNLRRVLTLRSVPDLLAAI